MQPISFREISKTPLALSQKQHAVRSILEEISAKKKLPLNIKLETESSSLIRSYTRYGVAGSVMPWPSIHHMWKQGRLLPGRSFSRISAEPSLLPGQKLPAEHCIHHRERLTESRN